MASLRIEAQDVLDVAREGIGWIAVWKVGRSWRTMGFWPDSDKNDNFLFDSFELDALRNITALDPNAIFINSYYYNLGDTTCMTRDSLADALRWHYDRQTCPVLGFL